MRLLTRSDFDGLICAVLLKEAKLMDDWKFVHPNDIQNFLMNVTDNDILANVPYVQGCGLWFDHHSSEQQRNASGTKKYNGLSKPAPSCARVIWDYYDGHKTFPAKFDEMMEYVDRCDSGQLTIEEIENPKGWVLLNFIMDPRTGLGRYRDYTISNYQLMVNLIEACGTMSVEQILKLPDVRERITRYFAQQALYKEMILRNGTTFGNLVVIDLRNEEEILSGNRFTVYALYPDCNISCHIIWGLKKQNTVFAVGRSILNRTSRTDVGKLMLKYGGGGHDSVGTCQVPNHRAEEVLKNLIDQITTDG